MPESDNPKRIFPFCKAREYAILLVVLCLVLLLYYRKVILSGFDWLPGDWADARLNILVADSWRDFFLGNFRYGETRSFYPFPLARGFTDLSLSLYLFELPFRMCGMDYMHSALAVYMTMHYLAGLSMYYFARGLCKFSIPVAYMVTLVSVYGNNFREKLPHTQFYFLLLMPFIFICGWKYFQYWHREQRGRRLLWGACGILFIMLMGYSSYYSFYFFGVWCIVLLLTSCFVYAHFIRKMRNIIKLRFSELSVLLCMAVLLLFPLLYAYLPLNLPCYMRTWKEVVYGCPSFSELVNCGKDNLLWGRMLSCCFSGWRRIWHHMGGHSYGFPWGFSLIAVCGCLSRLRNFKCRKYAGSRVYTLMLFSIAFVMVLFVRVGDYTLFRLLYTCLPGSAAIRSSCIVLVFLAFPLAVAMGNLIENYCRNRKWWFKWIICAVLVFEAISCKDIFCWRRSVIEQLMSDVPQPPKDVRVFQIAFIDQWRPIPGVESENNFIYGLFAMEIAQKYNLYTLNGYSGQFPAGWLLDDPRLVSNYRRMTLDWIYNSHIDNVKIYAYDPARRLWWVPRWPGGNQ